MRQKNVEDYYQVVFVHGLFAEDDWQKFVIGDVLKLCPNNSSSF